MTANDFFREYATAMLVWQHVESELFAFFLSLFENPEIKRTGALYYSQESFGAKLKLAGAVAQVALTPEQMKEWDKLVKRMKDAASERNVLAHFSAVADFATDNEPHLLLAPATWVPQEIRRKRDKKYDGEELHRLGEVFITLAQDILAFRKSSFTG